MYFKMLKNDLKRKKGLNLILFLFITFASVLVFVGAVQIVSNLTRTRTADTLCRTADVLMMPKQGEMPLEEQQVRLGEVIDPDDRVRDWSTERMLRISSDSMDYPDYDEKEAPVYNYKIHFLCALPREHDLVYDISDQPFYVPNGSIAVPVNVAEKTGIGVGDTLRFTAQNGNVYEFTVSTVFKDNSLPITLRFIVSDADYEVLCADSCYAPAMFCIRMENGSYEQISALCESIADKVPAYVLADVSSVSDEFVMMEIISVFVVLISLFLILMILMTIRFTMIAELKEEEKEIGMMKALGVDSFRFRWMFAAKYTAFAMIGGAIGIAAGIPLSGTVVLMFGPNVILPERRVLLLIGTLCVIGIITVMIAFSLLVMRRIRKISVIRALRGENSGERFKGRSPLLLHRQKRMSVPAFLALSDLLGRLKRYLFLLVAYTLGTLILLLPFNARNSIITPSYSRVWLYHTYDFQIHLSDSQEEEISREMEKTGKGFFEIINAQIAAAGIPARIDTAHCGEGYLWLDGTHSKPYDAIWGEGVAEKISYRKGGRAPAAENEIALSAFTAGQYGITPGSTLKAEMYEYNADRTFDEKHMRQFTVTGLYDHMEGGMPSMILWDGYEDGYVDYEREIGTVIDAPDSEKPAVVAQLRDLYGAESVRDAQEGIAWELRDFDNLFKLLEWVVGIAVLLVLALITYLYENVFISEEVPEIALLKSTGFRNSSVRKWHLLRMLWLTLTSAVLGELLFRICGSPFLRFFMRQYAVTGLGFLFEFPVSFLLIPAILIGTVLLVTRLTLTGVRRIDIRRISEE